MKAGKVKLFLPFLYGILIIACQPNDTYQPLPDHLSATFALPAGLIDTIRFYKAEYYKWNHDFRKAIEVYQKILSEEPELESIAKHSIETQIWFCNLMYNTPSITDSLSYANLYLFTDTVANTCYNGDLYYCKALEYYQQQAYDRSELLFRKSLAIYRRCLGVDNLKTVRCASALGMSLYRGKHQLDSANYYISKAYEYIKVHAIIAPYTAEIYYNKAQMALLFRDYTIGEYACRQAITALQGNAQPRSDLMLEYQRMLAEHLKFCGKYQQADSLLRTIIALSRRSVTSPSFVASLYKDIFFIQLRLSDTTGALQSLHVLQRMDRKTDNLGIGIDRLYGKYYFTTGAHYKAIESYRKFLADESRHAQQDALAIKEAYWNMGQSLQQLQRFDDALAAIYRLITFQSGAVQPVDTWRELISEQTRNTVHISSSYHRFADILMAKYEHDPTREQSLEQAFQLYCIIDTLLNDKVDAFNEDAALHAANYYNADIYAHAVRTAISMYQLTNGRTYLNWANHFIEQVKSPLMYRDLVNHRAVPFSAVPKPLIQREIQLKARIDSLQTHYPGLNSNHIEQLLAAFSQIEDIYETYRQKYPEFYSAKLAAGAVDLERIQAQLKGKKESILQFHVSDHAIQALLIQWDTIIAKTLEKPPHFTRQIESFKRLLRTPQYDYKKEDLLEFNDLAHIIYQVTIQPFFTDISRFPNLTILPHGELHEMPFEVLTLTTDKQIDHLSFSHLDYLLKAVNIRYAYSLKSYLQHDLDQAVFKVTDKGAAFAFSKRELKSAEKEVLASRTGLLTDLPYSAEEIGYVRRFFPNTVLSYYTDATKSSFQKAVQSDFTILHLAVHADSDENNRLKNALYLRSEDTGYDTLWMYEIVRLPMTTRLVVLSACETGLGEQKNGEGVYSLSRAFLISGAETVMSTFWSINDKSTSMLMEHFYEFLVDSTPVEALQKAKKVYLEQMPAIQTHPALWAGMVCFEG